MREALALGALTTGGRPHPWLGADLPGPGSGPVLSAGAGAIVVESLEPFVPVALTGTGTQIDVEAA